MSANGCEYFTCPHSRVLHSDTHSTDDTLRSELETRQKGLANAHGWNTAKLLDGLRVYRSACTCSANIYTQGKHMSVVYIYVYAPWITVKRLLGKLKRNTPERERERPGQAYAIRMVKRTRYTQTHRHTLAYTNAYNFSHSTFAHAIYPVTAQCNAVKHILHVHETKVLCNRIQNRSRAKCLRHVRQSLVIVVVDSLYVGQRCSAPHAYTFSQLASQRQQRNYRQMMRCFAPVAQLKCVFMEKS